MANWLWRCPEGHSSTEYRETGYYCSACGDTYEGEPFDAREHEFPVEPGRYDKRESIDYAEALTALVEYCDDVSAAKVSHFDLGTNNQLAHAFRVLKERGLVESDYRKRRNLWRPTERGRRVAGGAGLDRDGQGRYLEAVADD